ncbi:MAG: hypothetical protein C0469_07270 [Cyanobacteria bacterium DS2.3.42]|nr:hypothetical protein [Cyanobacteria bacterium DS2.3.42]
MNYSSGDKLEHLNKEVPPSTILFDVDMTNRADTLSLRTAEKSDDTAYVFPLTITQDGKPIDPEIFKNLRLIGGIYDGNPNQEKIKPSPPFDVSDVEVDNVTSAESRQISQKVDDVLRHMMGLPVRFDGNTPDDMSLNSSEIKIASNAWNAFRKGNPAAFDKAYAYLLKPDADPSAKPAELAELQSLLFDKFIPYERKRNSLSGN